jgi:hypothetical protein
MFSKSIFAFKNISIIYDQKDVHPLKDDGQIKK